MKNSFFIVHSINGHEIEEYISEVKEFAANIGILLIENETSDKVIAKFPDHDDIIVMQGMYNINGEYMPRWYEAQHNNLPERLVHYAMVHHTAGKKHIRLAKREFDTRFPQVFDRWLFDFEKGITPNGWVSIV